MAEESVVDIKREALGNAVLLVVSGKVDALTSPEFKKSLADAVAENPRIIVDMAGVTYISSAGVGALIENKNNASKLGGEVALCAMIPDVQKVFDLLGFSKFFKIVDTREAAVSALG